MQHIRNAYTIHKDNVKIILRGKGWGDIKKLL